MESYLRKGRQETTPELCCVLESKLERLAHFKRVYPLLSLSSRQHCSWQCVLSPSRWLQLRWQHLLLLFHLLALARALGKMKLRCLSAPSSITICQTSKKKALMPKAEEVLVPLAAIPRTCLIQDSASLWLFSWVRGWEGGAQMCSFHLSPTIRNEDPSDWEI